MTHNKSHKFAINHCHETNLQIVAVDAHPFDATPQQMVNANNNIPRRS